MTFQPTITLKSPKLSPKGSPSERLWIIAEAPLSKDQDKGFLFSSPMGWSYDKMLGEAGIRNYYVTYFSGPDDVEAINLINQYQPPIIVALDLAGKNLVSGIYRKEDIHNWAGSLLTSDKLLYPHFVIPTFGPETCISDWTERQIVKYIDYGKVRDELLYWQTNGTLQPLPERKLDTDLPLHTLLYKIRSWIDSPDIKYISVDIETVYPKEKSQFFGHPGMPVTISIAISSYYAVSFSLFQETTPETVKLWKVISELMQVKKVIGQNFFQFDQWHFELLGLAGDRLNLIDTMFRHAILWPELPHTLAFMTRQYTRQPYYKSMAHGWSIKNLEKLKLYNALDTTVTYEIFERQEEEFDQRPHLR